MRSAAGLVLAAVVALAARRAGVLAPSGVLAAILVGTVATAAGWGWAALLIGWFVASSALTRLGGPEKERLSRSSLAPASARTALQVAANGGLFAMLALMGRLTDTSGWFIAASGALAAAAADTWATELGLLWGGPPRALLGGGPVAPGMSGGVTVVGLLGSVAGALAVSVGAAFVHGRLTWPVLLAVATAGTCGALTDSALGGSLQSRRWCATCARFTERSIHDCGTATTHARGLRWMTNDTVNLIATAGGALVALALVAP